eukprot:CAMPEP_0179193424 /NCGR_PEP_ID=MMETSP0796-20121207/96119_1 /TAXON_ID=73915 /ORGANISM="Pyrodinium bahamense, Strain pbaha01" /LENGTH=41 /DNA_ID= /DNA_START= /DNA_END= /DNA_ORIENTATION=
MTAPSMRVESAQTSTLYTRTLRTAALPHFLVTSNARTPARA